MAGLPDLALVEFCVWRNSREKAEGDASVIDVKRLVEIENFLCCVVFEHAANVYGVLCVHTSDMS